MTTSAIKHYPTCHADYPEKSEGEQPQAVTRIDLGDGETVVQCNDCGAHVLVKTLGRAV